jgi:hypothetical protein
MKQPNDPSLWQRNDIQYPRLISEILASGALDDKSRTMICDSMDLQPHHLQDLLTRAQHDWTTIKKTVLSTKQPPATLRCPHCKYNGKRPTENGQGFRYLSDQTTWREVSSFKDATLNVNSWYEVYDEDHETNERLECRSCLNEFPIPHGVETEFS